MDLKILADKLGFEEEEYLDIAKLFFIGTTASDLDRLEQALQREDVKAALEAAHTVKGASGNIGLDEAYEVAKGIEMHAREGSLEGAGETLKSLKDHLSRMQDAVKSGQ